MANACPNCRAALASNAVLCTSCGYNAKTGAVVECSVEEPLRERIARILRPVRWAVSPWFQFALPCLLFMPMPFLRKHLEKPGQERLGQIELYTGVVYISGLFIIAALIAYLRTKDEDHSFFRAKGFIGALYYSRSYSVWAAFAGLIVTVLIRTYVL